MAAANVATVVIAVQVKCAVPLANKSALRTAALVRPKAAISLAGLKTPVGMTTPSAAKRRKDAAKRKSAKRKAIVAQQATNKLCSNALYQKPKSSFRLLHFTAIPFYSYTMSAKSMSPERGCVQSHSAA
jgi:hypothetical protein